MKGEGQSRGEGRSTVRGKVNEEGCTWRRNRDKGGGGGGVENRSEQGGMENSKNLHHNRG